MREHRKDRVDKTEYCQAEIFPSHHTKVIRWRVAASGPKPLAAARLNSQGLGSYMTELECLAHRNNKRNRYSGPMGVGVKNIRVCWMAFVNQASSGYPPSVPESKLYSQSLRERLNFKVGCRLH